MRKLIYSIFTTVDGYIAGPNGELDWAIVDEELHTFVNVEERDIGAHLYGRLTWEVMSAHWPTADQDPNSATFEVEYARIWQAMPKVVFSTTLDQVEGNARLVKVNAVEEIRELKAQPGGDLAIAGAELAATATRAGLIDEYRLYVHPVVLGDGKPMFPAPHERLNLSLAETRTFSSGVVYLRYRRSDAESAV